MVSGYVSPGSFAVCKGKPYSFPGSFVVSKALQFPQVPLLCARVSLTVSPGSFAVCKGKLYSFPGSFAVCKGKPYSSPRSLCCVQGVSLTISPGSFAMCKYKTLSFLHAPLLCAQVGRSGGPNVTSRIGSDYPHRIDKLMDGLKVKLETAYKASGGRKVNIISHSMGGLLVMCFISLHNEQHLLEMMPIPDVTDPDYTNWLSNNTMIMPYLINSMIPEVEENFLLYW
ncbi:hypothetical protein F3Y22_tig00003518pilonHSYRG00022 [Hibiscus syriacus]|uniref:Uncharacterized protein n=1 Tax=Hibiscus syriacus TaxID=106335 RepID=A0A6A3CL48_HIBSY|nr:hypothetical protein F3Y22_tig00003518pilonHSYRG00022 [Hibiscus syriacus]